MRKQATLPPMISSTKVSDMTGQGFVHGVYALVNPQIGTKIGRASCRERV